MYKIVTTLLIISLSSLVIGSIILIIRKAFGKRLHPLAYTILWSAFLIRLLIPLTFENSNGIFNISSEKLVNSIYDNNTIYNEQGKSIKNNSKNTIDSFPKNTNKSTIYDNLLYHNNDKIKDTRPSLLSTIIFIWISGIILSLCLYTYRLIKFRKYVKRQSICNDDSIISLLMDFKSRFKIKREINIVQTDSIGPCIYGFLHPYILIPESIASDINVTNLQRKNILLHEITHIKRNHTLLLNLVEIIKIIYWFNPFIYIFTNALRSDMETICDYYAIRDTSATTADYMDTLVSAAVQNNSKHGSRLALTSSSKNELLKRLNKINNFKNIKRSLSISISLITMIFILTGCSILSAKKQEPVSISPENTPLANTGKDDSNNNLNLSDTAQVNHLYPAGTSITIDLNGDNKNETIIYDTDGTFKLNDMDYSKFVKSSTYGGDLTSYGGNNPLDIYCIVDIDTSDSQKEIAIMIDGPSSDPETFLFAFDGSKLIELGSVPGNIDKNTSEKFSSMFPGDGGIYSSLRLSILQTWFAPGIWILSPDNKISLSNQELYYPYDYEDNNDNIILKEDLPIHKNMTLDDSEPTITMKPQKVSFTATDNKNWCLIKGEDNTYGWLYIENVNTIPEIGGKFTQDVFENLSMYD